MSNPRRVIQVRATLGVAATVMLAISGAAAAADASADVVAVGPLDSVAPTSVTVLGREFQTRDTYGLSAGQKVAVHGTLQADGSVSDAWVEAVGDYVPGSDLVYESGVVSHVNETFGTMTINGSEIDYTASLSSATASVPTMGQMVSVVGTQPSAGGTILATTTTADSAALKVVYTTGGNTRSLYTTGGNNRRKLYTTGGNAQSLYTTGGNAQSLYTTGGNANSLYTTGGNAQSLYTTGGNAQSLYTTGGNAQSLYTTGGNVHSLYTTGGNAN